LGRRGRREVKDRAEGDAAQDKMNCDFFYWTASCWLPVACMMPPARPGSRRYILPFRAGKRAGEVLFKFLSYHF
jgi:hypothetical protein